MCWLKVEPLVQVVLQQLSHSRWQYRLPRRVFYVAYMPTSRASIVEADGKESFHMREFREAETNTYGRASRRFLSR